MRFAKAARLADACSMAVSRAVKGLKEINAWDQYCADVMEHAGESKVTPPAFPPAFPPAITACVSLR